MTYCDLSSIRSIWLLYHFLIALIIILPERNPASLRPGLLAQE